MRKVVGVLVTLGLIAPALSSQPDVIRGRAQILTWNNNFRVVLHCDSQQRYQLGVFTSVAAAASIAVDQAVKADPSPLLVELTGFPASLPSGWEQAPEVAGVISVGHIAVAERGTMRLMPRFHASRLEPRATCRPTRRCRRAPDHRARLKYAGRMGFAHPATSATLCAIASPTFKPGARSSAPDPLGLRKTNQCHAT